MLVKNRYPSRFDDLVQREAVRLGEKFQVAGKWCSFVAVAANDAEIAAKQVRQVGSEDDQNGFQAGAGKFTFSIPQYR
jgi:hypothetical protein